MPEGKDPDELIRKAPERWPEVVASARPFLDFYIDVVTKDVAPNDARAKSEAVNRVVPVLRQLADRVMQAHYVHLLAQRLRIDERVMSAELHRAALQRTAQPERRPAAQ
ncbi:MAG: DNA primase, partial [Chloroflexota bacterium]